jgi:hypothetical protein
LVKIVAESLLQRVKKHVVQTPLSGVSVKKKKKTKRFVGDDKIRLVFIQKCNFLAQINVFSSFSFKAKKHFSHLQYLKYM